MERITGQGAARVIVKSDKRWYEKEQPVSERAGPIRVRWFRRAERLQFASIRTDPYTGKQRAGLTFTVRLSDLQDNPAAVELIEGVLQRARGN